MFGFGRRKKRTQGAETFVEATGGGWGDADEVVAIDGGEHADYVDEVLRDASEYARRHGVAVGEEFAYTLTRIPRGIASPHEIVFGIIMRASDYGLSPGVACDETLLFVRTR